MTSEKFPMPTFIQLHPEVIDFFRSHGDIGRCADVEMFYFGNSIYVETSKPGIYTVLNQ